MYSGTRYTRKIGGRDGEGGRKEREPEMKGGGVGGAG